MPGEAGDPGTPGVSGEPGTPLGDVVTRRDSREEAAGGSRVSVIPQIATGVFDPATGLRYGTTIQITNAGLSTVTLSAEFFNADGTDFTVPLDTNIDGVAAFAGSLNNFVLQPNSTAIITAGDSSAAAAV